MPSAIASMRNACQRARPAAGTRRLPPSASRYCAITFDSTSCIPSSVSSAGIFISGLWRARSRLGEAGFTACVIFSMRPSSPFSIATTITLRTNGESGE